MPPDENKELESIADADTKIDENGKQFRITGNREYRRRAAKAIAREKHLPFQTVNQVLNKKTGGPVKL